MLKKGSLLLACLATVAVPTFSQAAPYPTTITSPPPATNLQVPNNVRVNPTIMGKIEKPPSVTCDQLIVRITEYAPSNFPQGGGTAVLTNATRTSCTYKIQVPQAFLGKKVYLWGNLKNPSPLVTVNPVGWNNPLPLPPELGVVENFNFVVKETVIH
ncbi:hypothetical protein RYO59_001637 [Thermosynechococcaceae cyanobacterium Okahandja]